MSDIPAANPTKQCSKCKEVKELGEFTKSRNRKNGVGSCCKDCKNKQNAAWQSLPYDPIPEIKICTLCLIGKNPNRFSKAKNSRDGLCPQCKDCNKINANLYREQPLDPQVSKICASCNTERSPQEYSFNKTARDGLQSICRDCAREARFKKDYGISIEYYNQILEEQDGKCAICHITQNENVINNKSGEPARFAVDHCHRTGNVRGLLCDRCNRALGALRDNPKSAENAAAYLRSGGSIKQKGHLITSDALNKMST